MSQYGSNGPPAGYVPQNQAQGYGAPQQPSPSIYQPNVPQNVHAGHHKPGGAFGQMMNQAVTTGVPMLNKLGKTISSKWVGKPASSGPPQHLQNYQNYQDHHGQQNQTQSFQTASQPFNNQASPQPWQQLQQQQQLPPPPQQQQSQGTTTFSSPQQSPFQQPGYGSPASGHSGQSNYFGQQAAQPTNVQGFQNTQSGISMPGYGAAELPQGASSSADPQRPAQYGQHQMNQDPSLGQFHTNQQSAAHTTGQQSGVVIGSNTQNMQSPHLSSVSPDNPSNPNAQSQWGQPAPNQEQSIQGSAQQLSSGSLSPQSSFSLQNQQSWSNVPPMPMQSSTTNTAPQPAASPPVQSMTNQRPAPPVEPSQTQSSVSATPGIFPSSAPTEFIAELPADLESLSIVDSKVPKEPGYQAYHPPASKNTSSSPGFTIPRRTVSANNVPFADPWRFADPVTELPTREFYVLADLLFDALDRKFEPQNTGLLEAPKILKSWTELTEEAARLFSYNWYNAVGNMWSLEGIPHVMVPVQPSLSPVWNFNEPSHGRQIKLEAGLSSFASSYATYVPALNRAGWYKFFFLEMMHAPDDIARLIPAVCGETYKPGLLHQPDLAKREPAEAPGLMARAAEIQTAAVNRVCDETKAAMMHASRESAQ